VRLIGEQPPDKNSRPGRRDVPQQGEAVRGRFTAPSESHRKTIAARTSVPVFGKTGEPLNKAARKQMEGHRAQD
jgi:hypothetical protein